MLALDFDHLDQYSDALRLRSGAGATVRFVGPGDAVALQAYFRGLSARSRYNRLMGAASELPAGQLDQFTHPSPNGRFSVVVTIRRAGREVIVAEARYACDHDTAGFEFGLSVDDRWQGQGIGAALLANLQCRAAALGANLLIGDTLRSNEAMLALARKAGFGIAPTPNDWKQVRFQKPIDVAPSVGCASLRLAAQRGDVAAVR